MFCRQNAGASLPEKIYPPGGVQKYYIWGPPISKLVFLCASHSVLEPYLPYYLIGWVGSLGYWVSSRDRVTGCYKTKKKPRGLGVAYIYTTHWAPCGYWLVDRVADIGVLVEYLYHCVQLVEVGTLCHCFPCFRALGSEFFTVRFVLFAGLGFKYCLQFL